MKCAIRFLTTIFLIMYAHLSCAITIVGDDAYPPYSFLDQGKITGIYVDIIQHALDIMGDSSSISVMPWKRGLSELEMKKIDALFPPYNRPKLRPYMLYSTDILNETLVIVCNSKVADRLMKFPRDYNGIRLNKNSGFSPGEAVAEAVKRKIIKLDEAKGMSANLKMLIRNRIDCYVNDRFSILYELKKMAERGEYDGYSIVETHVLGTEKGYVAIHNDATTEVKDFIAKFNDVIEEMKLSGKIDEVILQYSQ